MPADLIYSLDPVWQGFAPPGFSVPSNQLLSDVIDQNYPWHIFSSQNLHSGILPLWNPFVLGGTPFLANQQSAILYPLNLLSYLLPMPVGIGYVAIIRLLIAALGSYYYLRLIGTGKVGAFTGACAFTLSGFIVTWLGYSMSNVATLLPLLLLLAERLVRFGRPIDLGCLALVVGVQFLGGHPETSFHVGVVWAAYVMFRTAAEALRGAPLRRAAKLCLSCVAAFVLGFAIASVQVLPFVEILSDTTNLAARQGLAGTNWLFFPGFWRSIATAVTIPFPNAFGNPAMPDVGLINPFSNFNEQAAYVGTVPLALAVVGATTWRRNRFVAFWLFTALIAVGVAYRLPGFEVVNHLPIFSVAANGRFRLAVTFGAAVLCAFGTERLVEGIEDRRFRRHVLRWLGLTTTVGLIGILSIFVAIIIFKDSFLEFGGRYVMTDVYGNALEPLEHYLAKLPASYDSALLLYGPTNLRVYPPIIFAACLLLAVALFGRKADKRILQASIVLLTVIDLAVLAYGYNPTSPVTQVYPETASISFLKQRVGTQRIAGIGGALRPNASMLFELRDVRGYENTSDRRVENLFNNLVTRAPFGMYTLMAKPSSRYFDLLGVKYFVAKQGAVDPGSGFPLVFSADGVQVYENPGALPRAFVIGTGRVLPDEEAMLGAMRSPTFKPGQEVLLEARAPSHEPSGAKGEAAIRDPNPNEVEVTASTSAPAWLVLSDTFDDGWKAYVDGQEQTVYRANYVMRAVRLEAGTHVVAFRYEPTAFKIGLYLSGVSLLLTAAILALSLRSTRRSAYPHRLLGGLEMLGKR